jgi:hypothetical protein
MQKPHNDAYAVPTKMQPVPVHLASPQTTQLPSSSNLPPPAVRTESKSFGSGVSKFAVPLQDLLELTYMSTGYFNVQNPEGEGVFHIEVRVTSTNRVLEVSKVFEPGHSEVLASVGTPNLPTPQRPSQIGGLPPDVLEVRLQDGRQFATIEAISSGSYQIVKDGRKIFTIDGDSVELEIDVISAVTGRPAARMERKGVIMGQNMEVLELTILPGSNAEPIPLLASVLGIIVLKSWPMRIKPEEMPPSEASRGAVTAMFSKVIGVTPAGSADLAAQAHGQMPPPSFMSPQSRH